MDNTEKRCSSGRGWRISTPSFPENASMDSFYADAHNLLEQRFTELHECGEQGIFTADHLISERTDGTIEITLRLRRRINGKYIDERLFSHRWRDGAIAAKLPGGGLLRGNPFLKKSVSPDPFPKNFKRGQKCD